MDVRRAGEPAGRQAAPEKAARDIALALVDGESKASVIRQALQLLEYLVKQRSQGMRFDSGQFRTSPARQGKGAAGGASLF